MGGDEVFENVWMRQIPPPFYLKGALVKKFL